jgi:outer membrane protein OmpA-like peptidoglycan-associated protein
MVDTTITENIVISNIHFYGGSHQFLPGSMRPLDELLQVMISHANLVIEIRGHICCVNGPGDAPDVETRLNNLSEARAKAVHDFLVENGITKERVSFKGLAHTEPVYPYPEKTEQERISNRRVEIKILAR